MRVPCVVMGHGGSGTKRLGLPKYAAKFASLGVAVLTFDYRHFGASEGEPRQLIDVAAQREDYRAAIRYVRGRADIDPRRIALWVTSLSGGHGDVRLPRTHAVRQARGRNDGDGVLTSRRRLPRSCR